MSVTVANTAANLSGDTLLTAENAETLTGQKTFSNTILFSPDSTYDIGASGANRPRDVFIADDLTVGDAVTIGGTLGVTGIITGRVCSVVSSTTTGTQAAWNASIVDGDTFLEWSGASALTVQGITAEAAGRRIFFVNTGSSVAHFVHQSGSAAVGEKLYLPVTSGNMSVMPRGHITFISDGTNWVCTSHEQGRWITPTFADSDFTGDGTDGNWALAAGDVTTMRYYLNGSMLTLAFELLTTTVANTPTQLRIGNGQWGGFTATNATLTTGVGSDNGGANEMIYIQSLAAGTYIPLIPLDGAAWSNATNTTNVYGIISFEVT